jgi:spore germination cell wall hydrolase CwlJ-like protein
MRKSDLLEIALMIAPIGAIVIVNMTHPTIPHASVEEPTYLYVNEVTEGYIEPVEEESTSEEPYSVNWEEYSFIDTVSNDWSECEGDYLQKIAYAEAGNQGVEGMALVMNVVLNRVVSDEFPDTIWEVITQDGQFEAYTNGNFDTAMPNELTRQALGLVETGWDESQGCTYFRATSDEPTWHDENLEFVFQYKDHKFYR